MERLPLYYGKWRSSVLTAKFESGLRRLSHELFLYLELVALSSQAPPPQKSPEPQRPPSLWLRGGRLSF